MSDYYFLWNKNRKGLIYYWIELSDADIVEQGSWGSDMAFALSFDFCAVGAILGKRRKEWDWVA